MWINLRGWSPIAAVTDVPTSSVSATPFYILLNTKLTTLYTHSKLPDDGVWTAEGKAAGMFQPPQFGLADFGARSADAVIPPAVAGARIRAAHAQHSDHARGGEERLYRLPPVSRGAVIVKAFHADVSTRAASNVWEASPLTDVVAGAAGPTLHSAAGPPVDDDGRRRPAQRHVAGAQPRAGPPSGHATMASHGNLVLSESPESHRRLAASHPATTAAQRPDTEPRPVSDRDDLCQPAADPSAAGPGTVLPRRLRAELERSSSTSTGTSTARRSSSTSARTCASCTTSTKRW